LKIAIIGNSSIGGGYLRAQAFKKFLESRNNQVDLILCPDEGVASRIAFYYQRARARIKGHEKQYYNKTADQLEKRIKAQRYDVVIGVEAPFSYVLTRELGCLKIFCCETLEADELYFSQKFDNFERIRDLREMEIELFTKSDYVIFPWVTTENYARKHVWDGNNFVTIKFGCYPKEKPVSYFFPFSIVSLGSLRGYWADKELLSYLTRISTYRIDAYGKSRPSRKYHINYKGYAPTLDVFYDYQFGLETVPRWVFRLHSSRIMSYLAYGLPVLSPAWMNFSHELKGVLPYNEDNFLTLLEEHSDRERWERLSEEAYEQARELDWSITLRPLEKLIEK